MLTSCPLLFSSIFSRWQVLTAQSDTKEEVWYLAYSATQTCLLMGEELDLFIYRRCTGCNKYINYMKQYTKIPSVHSWCQCGYGCVIKFKDLRPVRWVHLKLYHHQHNISIIIVISNRIRFLWKRCLFLVITLTTAVNKCELGDFVGEVFCAARSVWHTIREIWEILNSSVYGGIHCHHFNWNFLDLCVI